MKTRKTRQRSDKIAEMSKFNWLHLTDLHLGMSGQDHLWPNVRKAFFDDLKVMHDVCGGFDAVFFTGDFVQKGSYDEFNRLNEELERIWETFGELGSKPVLFTVPGNHDLARRTKVDAATRALTQLWDNHEVQDEFWKNADSEYRSLITDAFQNYETWSNACTYRHTPAQPGVLPGDFSSTLEVNGLKIGVVGLNTTFLQLTTGDYEEKLAWDSRQLYQVCGQDPPAWVCGHHLCFLLTHQGPAWLNKQSQEAYSEINPAGRFSVHLFGHMHKHDAMSISMFGGASRRTWQGCSMFGLEHFGDDQKEDRRHGYSVGQVGVTGEEGWLRCWPRLGKRASVDGWWISPDTEVGRLESDNGTPPAPIAIQTPALNEPIEEIPPSSDESQDAPKVQLWREQLSIYRQELTRAEDPAQKMNLRRLIQKLQKKISGDDEQESANGAE